MRVHNLANILPFLTSQQTKINIIRKELYIINKNSAVKYACKEQV